MKSGALMLFFVLITAALLNGCVFIQTQDTESEPPATETPTDNVRETPAVSGPRIALREIYISIGPGNKSELVGMDRLLEIIGITSLPAAEIYARYSDPRGGLADVVIIKPEEESMVEVREALYRYRDRRVAELENFDVLGSLDIAQNAVIFEHGEYVVLLMTPDNDAAQMIISQFMPL
ncbi:MAG: DUF4358 domain-containing protein [Oscillospiraceae bacterium]|nr:DUF4358 domain-containing protein [Oscillospiraceae bacterium]